MRYHAFDETGYVAWIEPNQRPSKRYHAWILYWASGRSFETFKYLSDAQAFVQRLRHTRKIEWTKDTAQAFSIREQG